MKKTLLSILLLGSTTGVFGQTFSLSATHLPERLNGKMAYFMDQNRQKLDSIKVQNGAFYYSSRADVMTPVYLVLDERAIPAVLLVREPGEAKYDHTSGKGLEAGPLNMKLKQFTDDINLVVSEQRKEAEKIFNDETIPQDQKMAKFKEFEQKIQDALRPVTTRYYEQNPDNVVGVIAFLTMPFATNVDYIKGYEQAPESIQRVPAVKDRYESAKAELATVAGSHFTDFEYLDANGKHGKLSDFVGDGKYLLVDFWASWCLPCRKAMPHLASLNAEYGPKGLRILSIGTMDEVSDNRQARSQLKMTWETIHDTEDAGVKTYAIRSIPTLLLISPEGIILYNGHNPAEVTQIIKSRLD